MNIKNIIKTVTDFLNYLVMDNLIEGVEKFLFRKKSSHKIDAAAKKRLIEWVQVYMNMNRGNVYSVVNKRVQFNNFSKSAKKMWRNVLSSAFSSGVMNDSEIGIEQMIVSDVFNYYYKGLFHEIRNISYNILDNTFSGEELMNYYRSDDFMGIHSILIDKHCKRFKVLQDVEKYGENIISVELKSVVEKLLRKKLGKK